MSKPRFPEFLILIILSLIWGFSFFFIKQGLLAFTPYQVGALRIFLSFIIVLPGWLFIKDRYSKDNIAPVFFMAILGSGIPPFLFAIAESKLSSGLAGILNSLTPFFVLVTGVLFFGTVVSGKKSIGIMIGLAGAIFVALTKADGSFELDFIYAFLIVLATASYGINANIIRKHSSGLSSAGLTVMIFTLIGPPAGIYLISTNVIQQITSSPQGWHSLGYLLILSWVGTVFALILFTVLVKRSSALFASLSTYLIPLVAVLVGMLDGEDIGLPHLGGLLLIMGGVYLSSK